MRLQADSNLELSATGAVLWRLPLQPWQFLPETLDCAGLQLARKQEFHITVLGSDLSAKHLRDAKRLTQWFEAWQQLDHHIVIHDEAWLLRKPDGEHDEHSLVTACHAPVLHEARRILAQRLQQPLPAAVPHITLYTQRNPHGISVADAQALAQRRIASGPWSQFGLQFPDSPGNG